MQGSLAAHDRSTQVLFEFDRSAGGICLYHADQLSVVGHNRDLTALGRPNDQAGQNGQQVGVQTRLGLVQYHQGRGPGCQ
ncbi:MAG: hypothetical protein ACI9OJ_000877 [Myxococcota bacterium]|jgi:hypothetical protein